jgi:peptidoglycan/xylan/chitin deacetylase (PgdA/CDA1 family)
MPKRIKLLLKRLYPLAHRYLSRRFPQALWAGSSTQPNIALTFDDGPHRKDTGQLLEVLARHKVPATFFFLGNRLLSHREVVHRVYRQGHQIALHGYHHRPFPLEKATTLETHLQQTQGLLVEICQAQATAFRDVRPPYGWFTPATLRRLERWGYRPVMWSVVPPHWLQEAPTTIGEVTRQTRNGTILILHEDKTGPTVASLADEIITRLTALNFHFVTIEQLWLSRS